VQAQGLWVEVRVCLERQTLNCSTRASLQTIVVFTKSTALNHQLSQKTSDDEARGGEYLIHFRSHSKSNQDSSVKNNSSSFVFISERFNS
jgi:hypothetical protein